MALFDASTYGLHRPADDDSRTASSCVDSRRRRYTALDGPAPPRARLPQPACEPSRCMDIKWRAQDIGLQTAFRAHDQAAAWHVNPYSARLRVADLNPLRSNRSMMSGAKWDLYRHYHGRQKLMQMLAADLRPNGDRFTRPIAHAAHSMHQQHAVECMPPPSHVSF